jgi:molybdenum cofactor guanylyltransferase
LKRSAIILALGTSKGFNEDKGLLLINEKTLIKRVIDAINNLVDEIVVVTQSQEQADNYEKLLMSDIKFVVCPDSSSGSLKMALCGLQETKAEYSLLLSFDIPLVSTEVIALLFDLSFGKTAVIPRSPDCETEALHAVYNTKQVLEAAKKALDEGQFDFEDLPAQLHGVRYLSKMVIEQLDPDLKTFFRILTPLDLKKAAVLSKPRKTKKSKMPIRDKN